MQDMRVSPKRDNELIVIPGNDDALMEELNEVLQDHDEEHNSYGTNHKTDDDEFDDLLDSSWKSENDKLDCKL